MTWTNTSDIHDRIEELKDLEDEVAEANLEFHQAPAVLDEDMAGYQAVLTRLQEARAAWTPELQAELKALTDAMQYLEGYCDTRHQTLYQWEDARDVAHDHFEAVNSFGSINTNDWPFNHIDWKAAGEELMNDFTQFELDEETYYVRG